MEALSLTVEGLSHRHPGLPRDSPGPTTFELAAGERALLVGATGSGKTTLILRVVGLLSGPGRVRVGALELGRLTEAAIRRRVGFLWQDPDDGLLLPRVLDDVCFGLLNDGWPAPEAEERARAWLERLGIEDLASRAIRSLSGGERQLVALAGVLAREPGLLLLDEPAASLDRVARERLRTALEGLLATQLMVTHDPQDWPGWRVAARLGWGSAPRADHLT